MTDELSPTRRYLALWFPHLSADRLRLRQSSRCVESPEAPLVFVTSVANAVRLAAVDARAQALGLVPGMTLADARARVPDLVAVPMDTAADLHWLEWLARDCVRYSPLVAMAPPDGISIDIAGSAHLFGGEAALADDLVTALEADGVTTRHAFASTAEGAQALARYARLPVSDERAALLNLPVVALGLDAQAELGLRRAGLQTLGAVAQLPRANVAARFGKVAVDALACILGDARQPIEALRHEAPLRFQRRFAEPVAREAMIAQALLDLMQDAARMLEARGIGGRNFRLSLSRSDGAKRHLTIRCGTPTRDPAVVLRLFDERIAALSDPLDPGFGYDDLVLRIGGTEPLSAGQPGLDGESARDDKLSTLIDRLGTRLGPTAIRRLVPHDSHIPEQAQLALPAIDCRSPQPWPAPQAGEPPLRPLFLFDPPQPVEVVAEVPDGPPHRFRWRRALHQVRLYEGPERIASEWWCRRGGELPGNAGLTRDYYRVEDVRGRRYWIFRHGLYAEKPDPRWYLHGLFA